MTRTLMIAETGENGGVQAVWLLRPGMRAARPVETAAVLHRYLVDAEISGASREDLMNWRPRSAI